MWRADPDWAPEPDEPPLNRAERRAAEREMIQRGPGITRPTIAQRTRRRRKTKG